jgi:hypothetical protein
MVVRSAKRSLGRGLADVQAGPNELISYSAFAGQEANDGSGKHSPYTEALLANMEKPGLEISKLFRIVADVVQQQTAGDQVPYESSRLPGTDIFLVDPQPLFDGSVAAEWNSVKDELDKAIVEGFLAKYSSDPFYSALAKRKIEELAKTKVAALPDPAEAEATKLDPGFFEDPPDVSASDFQAELKRLACYSGAVDGKWGRGSNASLSSFNKYAKLSLDGGNLDAAALSALKSKQGSVCPTSCEIGMTVKDGDCVKISCGSGAELDKNGSCVKKKIVEADQSQRRTPKKAKATSNCFTLDGTKFCE